MRRPTGIGKAANATPGCSRAAAEWFLPVAARAHPLNYVFRPYGEDADYFGRIQAGAMCRLSLGTAKG